MNEELVSIITPSYNSSAYIEETIRSILLQTYPYWELLITDDCSTDNSMEIIKGYVSRDSRIKLFQLEKNSGAGVARNFSIKEAGGRFIAFCDSDDRWMPDKLEKQVAFMLERNCALSYTSYEVCSEIGKRTGIISCKNRVGYWDLVRDGCIGCLTVMYDTAKLGKVLMPDIRKRQDWALWLLIIKRCKYALGIKEPLAVYRKRSGSISSSKWHLVSYNIKVYQEILHFSMVKSYIIFGVLFMPTYILKKFRQKYFESNIQ